MKLHNYSAMSKLIWDSWSEGKIDIDQKDEMLEHLLKVPQLEEQVWWLRVCNIALLIISKGLLLALIIAWAGQ